VEEGNWRIGRSLPENLLHGRPVGSEVFLQPSANFNTAYKKGDKAVKKTDPGNGTSLTVILFC